MEWRRQGVIGTPLTLDAAIGIWITGTYNARRHSEIGVSPVTSWCAQGWLPQMPDSLEDLDQLLVMVAKPRMVRRDGVHFQGLRFMSPTLAPYVGENVTVRYDPRDLGEVRVFHKNRFRFNTRYLGTFYAAGGRPPHRLRSKFLRRFLIV